MTHTISKPRRNCLCRAGLERLAVCVAAMVFTTGCGSMVDQAAFYPDDHGAGDVPALGLPVEEKHFVTEDGVGLHAYYLPNDDAEQLLVFFHGNGGNSTQRLGHAASLRRLGVAVLLPTYRGYPGSEGSPSEQGVYLDGQAALRFAEEALGFPSSKTFVLGRSLGSAVAVHAAQDRDYAGLVLVSPISSGDDFADFHYVGWMRALLGNPFDSVTKLPNVSAPILIIHGTNDTTLPVTMGHTLLQRARTRAVMVEVIDAGHNDLVWRAGPCYWLWIDRFLRGESVDNGVGLTTAGYRQCLEDSRTIRPASVEAGPSAGAQNQGIE